MYSHLNREQRLEMGVLRREGFSLRQIAGRLGVSPGTLSRELKRNASFRAKSGYRAGEAQRRAAGRKRAANGLRIKVRPDSGLERLLIEKIAGEKWSPEQVCGWLKATGREHVCIQTVYDWIYLEKRELIRELYCRKGKYRRRRENSLRKAARAEAAKARHISRRPEEAETRGAIGHWEGDTVVGKGRSGYIATFVDRKSGCLTAAVIKKKDFGAAGFAKAARKALGTLPAGYLRTLTLDNGPEMAMCERIERQTGLTVYYATPYHSWERGCNENANGLLRYFFPKKSSFANLTQAKLDRAVELINNRPRKRLDWQTPAQVFKR